MKKTTKRSVKKVAQRHGERGAALIMMLLIAMLLLAAGGALIMSTALSTGTVYEATPEMQAYYAAEAGLEEVLTVLRGNAAPLGAGTAVAPAAAPFKVTAAPTTGGTTTEIPDAYKISLRRALDHAYADLASDPNTAPQRRLSRWLNYNYTPPGGAYPDRVALVDNYSPLNGLAYRVTLSDPDNSTSVGYTTTGLFKTTPPPRPPPPGAPPAPVVSPDGLAVTFRTVDPILGAVLGTATVAYLPRTNDTSFTSYPSAASDLGSFRVTSTGVGATIPPGVTFKLNVNQKAPWQGGASLNAVLGGLINPVTGASTLQVGFQRDSLRVDGTVIRITNLVGKLLGLLAPALGGSSVTPIQASVTAPEPKRVIVESIGIGPRGAQKKLEMLVTRANLDFEPPATLTRRGANDCSAPTFDTGSSGAKNYTGKDKDDPDTQLPAIAVTACDYDNAVAGTKKPETVEGPPQIGILDGGTASGSMTTEPVETPDFLTTSGKARQYLNELEATARGEHRYFDPDAGTAMTGSFGTTANPLITFVDGDCELTGGAGMLIVTGNLSMSGNPSFEGIILVLGEGTVNRDGGGNGNINGSMVIASFQRTWPAADDDPAINNDIEYPFLAPSFNTNGGGNSTMQFSSTAVARALNVLGGPRVSGIAEL
ncbi:MAG TPA: hypothetical protein VM870_06160 [Pyrinomonadaceae bacterium]|nr:hypothetical protein [Pyrinomonadaceae bacterium]